MSEQMGAQIKEARIAADMTQKELAEAVDGLSAKSISEAERGLRELTDEQLAAIAEVTGAESLLGEVEEEASEASAEEPEASAVEDEAPEASAEEPEVLADEEEVATIPAVDADDILKLFNAADPAVKQAALSVLKGEAPQGKSFLDSVLPLVGEILGSGKDGNPLAAIMGFLMSEEGTAFLGTVQGALGSIAGMFSQIRATGEADQDGQNQARQNTPGSILIFTFAYSVAIYVLLLSFYFWQIRTDIKPEK